MTSKEPRTVCTHFAFRSCVSFYSLIRIVLWTQLWRHDKLMTNFDVRDRGSLNGNEYD
jgi:hypothetical protein